MKQIWTCIQLALSTVGGFMSWFLGGLDSPLYVLIVFVIADYISGVMCAIVDKKLSSEVGFKGIFKKVLIFIMVGVGYIIDTYLLGAGNVLRTAIIFFYCSNEGISMLENAGHLGLPIPQKLKDILAQLHSRSAIDSGSDNGNINKNDDIDKLS
ncbi:MAG: phage holin family protein [Oscillospiraceae bacterium]|nr:phage holin family protein [Oscillospiraceae bacterium]